MIAMMTTLSTDLQIALGKFKNSKYYTKIQFTEVTKRIPMVENHERVLNTVLVEQPLLAKMKLMLVAATACHKGGGPEPEEDQGSRSCRQCERQVIVLRHSPGQALVTPERAHVQDLVTPGRAQRDKSAAQTIRVALRQLLVHFFASASAVTNATSSDVGSAT
jgi:hypothetical protein